ncbi:hypothetical protein Strvi_6030 [Streptomyces violaceusniger Tu 4113]|uniref:Uncharacterized protein n=1 Tax=Streptomyces violaceusniger (strain Tu 4113) TaxID=653045 RepID=G2PGE8_STRV4|nr:hypothetical protein Strvi_6030 [Streptomyces violaceusniger Tu 4113]
MRRVRTAVIGAATAALGTGIWWCCRRSSRGAGSRGGRWLTVTIYRAPGEVQVPTLPEPLERCGDRLEIRVRPAPGNRGTEVAARPKEPVPKLASSLPGRLAGQDPRQEARTALREAKSLLEAGEVLLPDAPPTTHESPGGKVIGLLTRRSGGEGVL